MRSIITLQTLQEADLTNWRGAVKTEFFNKKEKQKVSIVYLAPKLTRHTARHTAECREIQSLWEQRPVSSTHSICIMLSALCVHCYIPYNSKISTMGCIHQKSSEVKGVGLSPIHLPHQPAFHLKTYLRVREPSKQIASWGAPVMKESGKMASCFAETVPAEDGEESCRATLCLIVCVAYPTFREDSWDN